MSASHRIPARVQPPRRGLSFMTLRRLHRLVRTRSARRRRRAALNFNEYEQFYLLHNPRLTPEELALLSESPHEPILVQVARNPLTPGGALERMSRSRHATVRYQVSQNPSAPEGARVLAALSLPPGS